MGRRARIECVDGTWVAWLWHVGPEERADRLFAQVRAQEFEGVAERVRRFLIGADPGDEEREAPKGPLFEIPAGATSTPCRSCGAPVYWVTTRRGKKMPVNADGTSHFASCPQAGKWRRA